MFRAAAKIGAAGLGSAAGIGGLSSLAGSRPHPALGGLHGGDMHHELGGQTAHAPGNTGVSGSMGIHKEHFGAKAWAPEMAAHAGGTGFGLQSMNGMAGVLHDSQKTEFGAQANLGGVDARYKDDQRSARFGMGLGVGGSLRRHHGDMPGIGADIGPFSMDYQSKTFDKTMHDFAKSASSERHNGFDM